MNRRAQSEPISAIILTATIVVVVIIVSAYIGTALYSSNANLEFQSMEKTSSAIADIVNSIGFQRYATDGIQMNLKYGALELFSTSGFPTAITITYNTTQTLVLSLLQFPTYNFSYIQRTGYVSISNSRNYLAGNGSLFTGSGQQLVTVYEQKIGRDVYINFLPNIQYLTQTVTFYNGSKVTYLYLNYVRFNTTTTALHTSYGNIFNFRVQATSLNVFTWKIVTSLFSVAANNCGPTSPAASFSSGCSFSEGLSAARPVVVVLSISTLTLSKT